jgi:hypothetical protein
MCPGNFAHVFMDKVPALLAQKSRVPPKERSTRLRQKIAALFDISTTNERLADRLRLLNPLLLGWASCYRHASGAKRVFAFTDNHVWWTILRWLHKKHPESPAVRLASTTSASSTMAGRRGGPCPSVRCPCAALLRGF